eukprot:5567709-Amphidinium_carterae.2
MICLHNDGEAAPGDRTFCPRVGSSAGLCLVPIHTGRGVTLCITRSGMTERMTEFNLRLLDLPFLMMAVNTAESSRHTHLEPWIKRRRSAANIPLRQASPSCLFTCWISLNVNEVTVVKRRQAIASWRRSSGICEYFGTNMSSSTSPGTNCITWGDRSLRKKAATATTGDIGAMVAAPFVNVASVATTHRASGAVKSHIMIGARMHSESSSSFTRRGTDTRVRGCDR